MHSCPKCGSSHLQKRGTREAKTKNIIYRQYKCNKCNNRFIVELPTLSGEVVNLNLDNKKYVITSYQNNTEINSEFLKTLLHYADYNDAELLILSSVDVDEEYEHYSLFTNKNFNIGEHLVVYSQLNISPTVENPLAGVDALSKGKSLIIGHPVLQMRTLPVFGNANPIMMHSTGTISHPAYNTHKKAGAKADHNHSYSALVVELDNANNIFHIRVLNSSEDGSFYDLDNFYDGDIVMTNQRVEAIVTGDTHVTEMDDEVYQATFGSYRSIVNELRPKTIVHHDILDFGILNSHHNDRSFLKRYEKFVAGKDSVVQELNKTCQYLLDNTPDFVENSIILASNHNEHITRWMESSFDKLHDYKNAKIYHYLMFKSLSNIEEGIDVNPFRDYFNHYIKNAFVKNKTLFLQRDELYYIKDILISSHGDKGTGGSRFSPTQGKRYPSKMIVGHSHAPSINGSLYTTGTMTGKLDYTTGTPINWMNTHCIIHQNGKRQLVNIIKGKWRL